MSALKGKEHEMKKQTETNSLGDKIASRRGKVLQGERECKYLQKGTVLWLTGLSGAGKTTLANRLERVLVDQNKLAYMLDGDEVRRGLNSDLGFSAEDRCENIRRIGEVARLFADASFLVIVAFISPFKKDRDSIRKALSPGRFIEVFVDCSLKVCEKRDVKGLYKKARSGQIEDFTGISAPYEPPVFPEIHLRTDQKNVDECIDEILTYLDGAMLFTNMKS